MSFLVLDDRRDGLAGFPDDFRPVARDGQGDVLAVDARGKVWLFEHGRGTWSDPASAFRSLEQLREFHAFQAELEGPEDEPLDDLVAREVRLRDFARKLRGAPFAKLALSTALDELRERIKDLRFWSSPRGAGLAARQELGRRCEQALRDAGAPGDWLVRAHTDDPRALVVVGPFTEPWNSYRVTQLLQPLLSGRLHLLCRPMPPRA
jgi:hypothetical protein